MSETGTVKVDNLPSVPDGAWGVADETTKDDYQISRISLMQALSKQVVNGVGEAAARVGEFRDSATRELIAGVGETFEAIIINRHMTWVETKDGKFVKEFALTDENRDLPWSDDDGTERAKTFNFTMLTVDELTRAPNVATPKVMSLNKTGIQTARAIQKYFAELKDAENKPSASRVISFSAEKTTNDKGTFYIVRFEAGRETTEVEMGLAYKWYQIVSEGLKSGSVTVHQDDEEGGSADGSASSVDDDDIPF